MITSDLRFGLSVAIQVMCVTMAPVSLAVPLSQRKLSPNQSIKRKANSVLCC